jgi:hypothetical protein
MSAFPSGVWRLRDREAENVQPRAPTFQSNGSPANGGARPPSFGAFGGGPRPGENLTGTATSGASVEANAPPLGFGFAEARRPTASNEPRPGFAFGSGTARATPSNDNAASTDDDVTSLVRSILDGTRLMKSYRSSRKLSDEEAFWCAADLALSAYKLGQVGQLNGVARATPSNDNAASTKAVVASLVHSILDDTRSIKSAFSSNGRVLPDGAVLEFAARIVLHNYELGRVGQHGQVHERNVVAFNDGRRVWPN